jgi:hypothetical protein
MPFSRFNAALLVALGLGCGQESAPSTPAPSAPEPPAAAPAAPATTAFDDLASVKAFDELMLSLASMREMVLSESQNEREASEGMRALLRILAMATDVGADAFPKAPHFTRMDTNVRKMGGDNPDAEYDHLSLDGDYEYRIRGNIGSVRHLSFTIMERPASGRGRALGYVNERTIGADGDGNFTLLLTHEEPDEPGTWIKSSPDLDSILVRQYIGSREAETLASYDIEVIGAEPYVLPPSTDAEIARALTSARYAFQSLATLHHTVMPELLERPNEFVRANSDDFGADISGSDNLYMFGTYRIEPDQALLIETDPLDVRYWNLAVESVWHETVDYKKRRTHRTLDDVTLDPDGKLRFVLAHGPTDHPNFLETGGHSRGWMTFRWVGERDTEATLPRITVVPLAELPAVLEEISAR